jgi:hypothetical protein
MRSSVAIAVTLLLASCGRTDPFFIPGGGGEESEAGPSETTDSGTDSTESGVSEESTDDGGSFLPDEESSDDGVEPKSCRDMLECLFGCVAGFDPQCFQMCGEGADPGELQAGLALMGCIVGVCVETDQCMLPDFAAESCIGCIGLGLFLPEPPGCEAEAMACQ